MSKELVKAPDSLSVWNSNMRELIKRQPTLAAVLHDYVIKNGHDFAHYETKTPEGTWVEGLTKEPFFQTDGEAKIGWTKKDRDTPIFFQYGMGTPPYLFRSIRALPSEALSLIVVEPSVALLAYTLHMTHVYAAMPVGATLSFIVLPDEVPDGMSMSKPEPDESIGKGDDDEEKTFTLLELFTRALRDESLAISLRVQGLFTAAQSKTTIHDGEDAAYPDTFKNIARDIREWLVMSLAFLGNSSEDTMLGLRQMSLMAPWMAYGYQMDSLLTAFKDRPLVVVSAGPSLSKNIELLRGIGDRCVIVANDAVLHKLLFAGIVPHVVCALERGIATYDLLLKRAMREFPDECSKVLLVAQAVCVPKIYGIWPGPKIIVGKVEVPVDTWFIAETLCGRVMPSGTSVAHMCLGLAELLGSSQGALIGQDLAYGDGGASHTDGVLNEEDAAKQSKAGSGRPTIDVPGIFGDTVETMTTWLSFIRVFESRIPHMKCKVYDCTEGGALIKGTIVRPFAEFIDEFVKPAEPFDKTPAEVVAEAGVVADKAATFAKIEERFKRAHADMDEADHIIQELVASLDKVGAPGLPTQTRVKRASETAALLDRLNRANPMFSFIAQSYMYLSTSEIAVTRFLDSVEMVERWLKVHRELIDGHIAVASFVRTWVERAESSLRYYVDHDLRFDPIDPKSSYDMFCELAKTLGDGHDQVALNCAMDSMLTFDDMEHDEWPGEAMWQCAKYLFANSRAQEALSLMRACEKYFDGREMGSDDIVSFMKDYARIAMAHDLCHIPDYQMARVLISNIQERVGLDEETLALRAELDDRETSLHIEGYILSSSVKRVHISAWYGMRAKVQRALDDGDVMQAFRLMWNNICTNGIDVPNVAAPNFQWLVTQMEKFFDVDDEAVAPVIDELLTDMAQRADVMQRMHVGLTYRFISELSKRGANVVLPELPKAESETEVEPEAAEVR